jgi:alkylated DNA repair dioxygenase AlkB
MTPRSLDRAPTAPLPATTVGQETCWPLTDGELRLLDGFLPGPKATALFEKLSTELAWEEETIMIAGRRVLVPRRVCWYGDREARYRYSGVQHDPLPWTPSLAHLRAAIEHRTGSRFNSVLGNCYRSGMDSMGWHADKEKSLGVDPVIASLSLGATRRFVLRHNRTRERVELSLAAGSLLIMGGRLQHCWRHCVPKSPAVAGARINLTFRLILES